MKASVVWIDGGLLYRFQQVVNPGPSMLIPWDISLHKMKHRVREIDHIRLELAKAVKSKDCGARAEALKEYVSSELYEAQQLALSELAKCGPATSKTNSPAKSQ